MDIDPSLAVLLARPRVRVRAAPGARVTRVTRVDGEVIRLDVAAPPESGKANREIERFLTRLSGRRAIVAVGATGKDKTVKLG